MAKRAWRGNTSDAVGCLHGLVIGTIVLVGLCMWCSLPQVLTLAVGRIFGLVLAALLTVACVGVLLYWRIQELREWHKARIRERRRRSRAYARRVREYEEGLQQQAEEIGVSLPGHLLRSFEEASLDWRSILRSVREWPAVVAEVCETDLARIGEYEFEDWTGRLFAVLGWSAQVTRRSGDEGADVVIEKGGCKAIVECKRHKSPIGGRDARLLLGSLPGHNADKAFLVTTSGFTRGAQKVRDTSDGKVVLVSGDRLRGWVEAMRQISALAQDAELRAGEEDLGKNEVPGREDQL